MRFKASVSVAMISGEGYNMQTLLNVHGQKALYKFAHMLDKDE